MSDSGAGPVELVVAQDDFAGAHFWTAANRLARRLGHGEHPAALVGQTDPTDRYQLLCVRCDEVLAVFTVVRAPPAAARRARKTAAGRR